MERGADKLTAGSQIVGRRAVTGEWKWLYVRGTLQEASIFLLQH